MKIKKWISLADWDDTDIDTKRFILYWLNKYYPDSPQLLSLPQCIELVRFVTRNYHHDTMIKKTWWEHVTEQEDSVIAHESGEIIDDLYSEIKKAIRHLIIMRAGGYI